MRRAILYFGIVVAASACVPETLVTPAPAETPPTMTEPIEPRGEILSGTFIGAGVTCPQFRLDSGEQVSLSGVTEGMTIGNAYRIDGAESMNSKCMQGREIRVFAILPG
ncbi:hypothetical protein J1C52_01775 [Roseibaca sp. Y0-43]|nr:hypothetical protein [Roseibaca sp. Y0-43]